MVLIDLVRCCHRSKPASRAPRRTPLARDGRLWIAPGHPLCSLLREDADACGTVADVTTSAPAPRTHTTRGSHFARIRRTGIAQSHTVAISRDDSLRSPNCFGNRCSRPKSRAQSQVPRDTAAMLVSNRFVAACRPADPSPERRQPGLSNGRTDRRRWTPIGPDGKPSGSSATHASCLSRPPPSKLGARVKAEPSAHKAPTIPHLETK